MLSSLPDFPKPIAKALSKLPIYPGSLLFATGLNIMLAKHLPADTLAMLENKVLKIQVNDAGVCFYFCWQGKKFQAVSQTTDVALIISASAKDFLVLIQRQEDPDTLFFNRRLVMQGDTELGLLAKNTLDSIDLSVFSWGRA